MGSIAKGVGVYMVVGWLLAMWEEVGTFLQIKNL